ncbi:sodium:proton antiporter [Vibrio sp. 10N.286.49.C2]|uniref:iron-sulfur cluster carrier protein ApbC n=1 Tax=unclassified Vibrio TaxID=2614977 RepID=UPI000C850DA6|nr:MULTISPECIES: iron-sulfur cluster carrier protein ApbC [unclassified Vibrio]PMH39622.1 sodium:proton antiporter [Vibrio sp. 10N.286.49.C2]PMH57759.1 sodium:proton antiporter [Vibrio sp. 10N.286.49.B1]PMH81416.1 sodium:proton antiporter [Vibrio sp. 10N.286.48.B7]
MRAFESKQEFCQWLGEFTANNLKIGWSEIPDVVSVLASGEFKITLPFANKTTVDELEAWIRKEQESQLVAPFDFSVSSETKSLVTTVAAEVKGVKNIIAVTSAKGGVGKSTTAVNLALAISALGAKVGILDSDVYGPSVPLMLGKMDAHPEVRDGKWMQPVQAHGIYTQSIGYLISSDDAAIWRGPMASKALAQLLNETEWPDLDYLILDMPPGTGDIQLTLSQQIPVTAAVIVTTPQDLALADAIKGVAMFEKVSVPVVGVIENMSYHICSQCGSKEHIFGSGGAEWMASKFGINMLAQVPLHIDIRESIDNGAPTVASDPQGEHAAIYHALAERVCADLYWGGKVRPDAIQFTMVQ